VLAVAAFTVLTIAVQRLIATPGNAHWAESLQGAGVTALVAITGLYAYATFRLLNLQENPVAALRVAAQEDAARRLLESLNDSRDVVRSLQSFFPLKLGTPLNAPQLEELTDHLKATFERIYRHMQGVAPTYAVLTGVVAVVMQRCVAMLLMLRIADLEYRIHLLESQGTDAEWSWDGLRDTYLVKVRPDSEERLEWEDVLKGKGVDDVSTYFATLLEVIHDHVMFGPEQARATLRSRRQPGE
jgi:hypothetical protein